MKNPRWTIARCFHQREVNQTVVGTTVQDRRNFGARIPASMFGEALRMTALEGDLMLQERHLSQTRSMTLINS